MVGIAATILAFSGGHKADAEPLTASYYGWESAYGLTTSGEVFDPTAHTAASPWLPFGTHLLVCYEDCTTVRINDRGPAPWTGHQLDLSEQAAREIGLTLPGADVVDVTVLD